MVLSATASVAATGWSRVAPPSVLAASTERRAQSAPLVTSPSHVTSDGIGAISLASIDWEGTHASALDSRGQRQSLTLDRSLQLAAMQLLRTAKPSRGAIVMLRVSDGHVLALAESPAQVSHASSLVWSANTPSASLFKLVTTAALVERAQIQPDHRVCSEGGAHRIDAQHLQAPRQGRVICSTFSEILAASRNAAYARLVHAHLSPEDLDNFADRFGFNSPLPADVPAELGRFHPATEPLAFARTATGFVGSSLSVLGAAYLGFVIAHGGVTRPLHLLEREATPIDGSNHAEPLGFEPDGSLPHADGRRPIRVMTPETASRLREMMEKVISHGTAADAFRDDSGRPVLPGLRIAGKTGTLGRNERTASWFVGFAPSRDPKLVVAVLLDSGSIWHLTAKRVASALMRQYFESANPQLTALR
jgi:penicillin-binding protein A